MGLLGGKKHTVVAGDSLASIAQQYGISPEALLKKNKRQLKSAEQLQPGMVLKVPKDGGSSSSSSSSDSD